MEPSGITFIHSNVDFGDKDLPFVISESITLRAATESEIKRFKNHLNESYGLASHFVIPFDHEPIEVKENGKKRTIYSESDKPRWWVVAFNGYNLQIIELGQIANLINPKLHFGSTFLFSEPNQKGQKQGVIFGPHSQFEILSNESKTKHKLVSLEELNKLKFYYESIGLRKAELSHVKYALDLYASTSGLRVQSGLLTLSLFSIIESLIAHKPRLTETLDSITHQIKNKINLLSKRFDINLEHSEYFGDIGFLKLWGKLYGLRSDIAHGQSYNFEGVYRCLKSLENTNNFLDKTVRELIKLSIDEADLIIDIRDC